jgi:hypothetical protein
VTGQSPDRGSYREKEVNHMDENVDFGGLKDQLKKRGLEPPVVHQVEPSLRTGSQVAFNPKLVEEIIDRPNNAPSA